MRTLISVGSCAGLLLIGTCQVWDPSEQLSSQSLHYRSNGEMNLQRILKGFPCRVQIHLIDVHQTYLKAGRIHLGVESTCETSHEIIEAAGYWEYHEFAYRFFLLFLFL